MLVSPSRKKKSGLRIEGILVQSKCEKKLLGAEIKLGRGIFIAKPLHDQICNFYSISPWEMESQEGIFKSFKLLQTNMIHLLGEEEGPD